MKWTQIKLDYVTHAYLKAEAGLNKKTMLAYIEELIKNDLRAKGYDLDRERQLQNVE